MIDKIKEAVKLCESQRQAYKLTAKSSPIEISIYNAFTRAKSELDGLLSVVEDAQGAYLEN